MKLVRTNISIMDPQLVPVFISLSGVLIAGVGGSTVAGSDTTGFGLAGTITGLPLLEIMANRKVPLFMTVKAVCELDCTIEPSGCL